MGTTKTGVSIDEETMTEIDAIVEECDDLEVSRSEAINAILTAYVSSDSDTLSRTRELIIKIRKGKL